MDTQLNATEKACLQYILAKMKHLGGDRCERVKRMGEHGSNILLLPEGSSGPSFQENKSAFLNLVAKGMFGLVALPGGARGYEITVHGRQYSNC